MMSADQPLIPFNPQLRTEDDLGIDLGNSETSSWSLGGRRYSLQSGLMVFLWLLTAGILAMTAMYHVVLDATEGTLLAWSATAGAVALLLGAIVLKQRHWSFSSQASVHQVTSLLLLMLFTVPSAQLLLTLVVSQDLSYTTFVLLLVIGYALLAPTTESLLLYLTVSLAAWSACALRCPPGAWMSYVLPWAGTAGLSLFIHSRIMQTQTIAKSRPKTKSVFDINLEESLRNALADRDRALSAKKQVEEELYRLRQATVSKPDHLPFLQEASTRLAGDVTLQDVGKAWLNRLVTELHAQHATLWVSEPDQQPQLAVSTSDETTIDDPLFHQALRSGAIIQNGSHWSCPLDLGLQGKAALLVRGVALPDPAQVQSLLHTTGAVLSLFLRWQLAEAESDAITQEAHQHRERVQQLQSDLTSLEETNRKVHEHLRSQWEAAQNALALHEQSSSGTTQQVIHWKSEAERFQKLFETAQSEQDTMTQLLDEAEAELKKLQSAKPDSDRVNDLEIKLKVAEAAGDTARSQLLKTEQALKAAETERLAAETHWDAAEKQLKQAEAQLEKAQQDATEAQSAWEQEAHSVAMLTGALRGFADAVVIFDPSGEILFENEPGRKLRGNARNQPGDHPLWKQVMTDTVLRNRKPWAGECKLGANSYQITLTPMMEQQTVDGYSIIARPIEAVKEVPVAVSTDQLAGARFFGGLAQTLEPPLTNLIQHADALLDASADQEIRRQALVGILQHGRYVRRLLEQACDFAQLEAGEAPIVKTACSPWQIVQQVVSQQRPSAEEKGLALSLQPLGAMPAIITSDPARLTAILQHLVSQSIRSTQSGSVIINVGMEQQKAGSSSAGKLRIDIVAGEVEQTSRLPASTMAVEFRQAITRRQSQAIGGELLAEQPGRSSLVVPVTASEMLNLVPMERLRFEKEPLPDVEWDQPLRGQALIVMDGQEQQRVTTYQLERMGLRCEVANDAEQAVNRIKEDWFDVVLWDAGKRDVSFVKVAQLLRSHFYRGAILGVGTPFLPAQREEFLAAGGDNLLPSPIVPAVWRHTLAGFLSRKMEMVQHSSESMISDYHADRDFLNLIRNYVAKLPSHLADMRAALQVADLARLARLSHALTDGSKLYGYPVLSDAAQKLEKLILQGRDSAEQVMQLDQIGHLVKKIENGMKLSRSNGYLALPGPLTKAA